MSATYLSRTEEVWDSWLCDRVAALEGDHAGPGGEGGEQRVFVCSPVAGEGMEMLFRRLLCPRGLVAFFCEGGFSSMDGCCRSPSWVPCL